MSPEPANALCPHCGRAFPATVKMCSDDGTVLELKQHPMASQLGKVLDGKYRLDSFISQGGMGAVFKATHVMLGKTVAVKLINPELVTSPDVVKRFQREARAATTLNHPNIVAVYDLGQTPEGTLYIAMEFVDGPSLKSVIASGGPIAPARTIAILRQIASALAVAHRNKIVHRDLKPHNIMLANVGQEGRDRHETVKLVDFGIAKTFDESTQLTTAGDAIGTPHYMAPEQAAGGQVDARTDLYSLGVIIYEMLTGEVPFNDTSTAAILVKHLKDVPERPSLRNPRVAIPPALEAIALKCLEKDPAARYQTAEEISPALDQVAATLPSTAMQADVTMPMAAVSGAKPSGDTRSTVVSPSLAAVAAVADAPPSSKSSNKGLVVGFAGLVVVLIAAGVYMNRSGGPAQDQTPAAGSSVPAPAAVPASAAPSDAAAASQPAPLPTPAGSSPPTASATAASGPPPSASSTPASSPASRASSAPSGGPSAVAAAIPSQSSPSSKVAAVQAGGPPAATPAPVVFPEAPAVFFHCNGAPEICTPLRAAVDDALEKAGMSSVRSAARADIDVAAQADVAQENVNRQFGTTFAVRNYSIDLTGEATRTNEVVAMPAPTTVSFDAQFGGERANEKARTVASDVIDRVKAFVRRKRGG